MGWPFKTIKQHSDWPFQPFLIQLAGSIISMPPELRGKMTAKTIERTCRMVARLAVEFGVPPFWIMDTMAHQLVREGGKKFKQQLEAAAAEGQGEALDKALDNKDMLTDFLSGLSKPTDIN